MAFANPSVLFFLLLLAIPIVIHLFNFKRYKRVYFTNLRFLININNETKKQSTLKKYLILATRLLAIMFLVFAFAKPYLLTDDIKSDLMNDNCVSIYVDNSFSMEGEVTDGVSLEIAKKYARQIVDSYGISDRFQILTNEFQGYQQRSYSKSEALDMIDEITISKYSRGLDKVLERQAFVLNAANGANKISYVISDFQRGMLPKDASLSLDSLVNYNMVRVNSDRVDNIYIDSCWFTSPVHNLLTQAELNVKIVNNSNERREQLPIKMFINNEQRAVANCDIEPNGETVVMMPYNEKTSGMKTGYVELTDYPIVYDDRLYFSYNVVDKFNVTTITRSDENPYLNALFQSDSSFNYITYSSKHSIDYDKASNSDIIILDGATLSSGLMAELKKFVDNGKTLVVFPPDDEDMTTYNQLLKLLDVGTYTTSELRDNKISDIASDNKIYRSVFKSRPDKIDLPTVNKWFRIESPINNPGEPLLRMINGDNFLLAFNNGVYMFASPLNSGASGFPLHSIFVPTLFNLAINSVSQNSIYYTFGQDNIHTIKKANATNGGSNDIVKIANHEDGSEFIPRQRNGIGGKEISFDDLDMPVGNYIVKTADVPIDIISMNYDRKESATDFYTDDELLQNVGQRIKIMNNNKYLSKNTELITNEANISYIFILLVLLLILTESLIIRFYK